MSSCFGTTTMTSTLAAPKPAFPNMLMWGVDVESQNDESDPRLQDQLWASKPLSFARSVSLDCSAYNLPLFAHELMIDSDPLDVNDAPITPSPSWGAAVRVPGSAPSPGPVPAAAAVVPSSASVSPAAGFVPSTPTGNFRHAPSTSRSTTLAASRPRRTIPRRTYRLPSSGEDCADSDHDDSDDSGHDAFHYASRRRGGSQRRLHVDNNVEDKNDVDFALDHEDDPHVAHDRFVAPSPAAAVAAAAARFTKVDVNANADAGDNDDEEDYATGLPWHKSELIMTTKELNAWVRARGLSSEQAKDLKLARRRIKNRFYARDSRARKQADLAAAAAASC